MIMLENYELFVDFRTSKSGNEYYGLFIKIGNFEKMLCFISKNSYDTIKSLSD